MGIAVLGGGVVGANITGFMLFPEYYKIVLHWINDKRDKPLLLKDEYSEKVPLDPYWWLLLEGDVRNPLLVITSRAEAASMVLDHFVNVTFISD